MGDKRNQTCVLLILVLLASCGGGADAPLSATQAKPEGAAVVQGSILVVIRHDFDRDGQPDVLTLDTLRNPLAIVEAIRGAADGAGTNATQAWRGREIAAPLNDALQLYLARSCSVATQTDIEVLLDGAPATVTVIE